MPKTTRVTNYHVQYQDVTSQHWHPRSEEFAGGDNLMTALENGWHINECLLTKHYYAGMRSVKVYRFHLSKGDSQIVMPVIYNPYVERLIDEEGYELQEEDSQAASA